MSYGEQSVIIGDIVGNESCVGGVLTKIFKEINYDLACRSPRPLASSRMVLIHILAR